MPKRFSFSALRWFATAVAFVAAFLFHLRLSAAAPELPNILWLVAEDINPHLGCYGDGNAVTPNIDRLAKQGRRYTKCWSSAPVCAPARTALITGVYPTSTGGENMRSEVKLPSFIRLYPQLLREMGYYCANNSKEDYNVTAGAKVWDESSPRAHYRNRAPGQPFFAAFNMEKTHESQIRTRPHTLKHDPARLRIPKYHPDTPEVRHDWAQYYDNITEMDQIVGQRLKELDDLGLAANTIVFFYGDNGSGMPRSKRWPYNSGLHVPLVVRVPEKWKHLAPPGYEAGGSSDRLVGFVDFAPTLISLAGAQPPGWMQGLAFMGRHVTPDPQYAHGFRGRMDERLDLVRSVRNQRFIYVRNYMPHLIYGQHIDYMFQTPTTRVWKELYDKGELQAPKTLFWQTKPPEELYDLEADPDEVQNLVKSQEYQSILTELRAALREHAFAVRDVGFLSEAEMHSRASGKTIYEMGHDPQGYPMEAVVNMAEAASSLEASALPELRKGFAHQDSAVRYWAALGVLMRGSEGVTSARAELVNALEDSSPSVAVTAARALGVYGPPADLTRALAVLREMLPPDKHSAYISMMALNAVDALGPKAEPLKEFIKTIPLKDPKAPARANSYVERLVAELTGVPGVQPNARAAPAGKKKGKAKQ